MRFWAANLQRSFNLSMHYNLFFMIIRMITPPKLKIKFNTLFACTFCPADCCKLVNMYDKRRNPSYTLLYIGNPKVCKIG